MLTGFSVYLDHYEADSPTNAQLNASLNWAQRNIGKRIHLFDPKITFTLVASQAKYDIRDVKTPVVSRKVLIPHVVTLGGNPLYQYDGKVGVWSIGELARCRPTYLTESAGTVSIAAFFDRYIYLSPAPSAVGSNNFISGTYIPADMSNDTDEPDIPEELHECLAYYAAVHAALPSATETEQWQRIQAYNAEWADEVKRMGKQNANALEGPWDDVGWKYPQVITG